MTSREVAEKFGVTVTTIYNWCNKGILKPKQITPTGRKIFDEKDVQKLIDSGRSDFYSSRKN